jgi:two-component system, response regulator
VAKHILLVEDNATDEKLTLRAFSKCGIANEIVVVRDGRDALDYLLCTGPYCERDPSSGPSLVLLDLNLPRMGGLDVLKALRAAERTRFLPVVVLTSSREEDDIMKSYSFGANAYVRKPVEFAEFAEAARALGMFWLLLNETAPVRSRSQES